jgi:hypothetical protein
MSIVTGTSEEDEADWEDEEELEKVFTDGIYYTHMVSPGAVPTKVADNLRPLRTSQSLRVTSTPIPAYLSRLYMCFKRLTGPLPTLSHAYSMPLLLNWIRTQLWVCASLLQSLPRSFSDDVDPEPREMSPLLPIMGPLSQ